MPIIKKPKKYGIKKGQFTSPAAEGEAAARADAQKDMPEYKPKYNPAQEGIDAAKEEALRIERKKRRVKNILENNKDFNKPQKPDDEYAKGGEVEENEDRMSIAKRIRRKKMLSQC